MTAPQPFTPLAMREQRLTERVAQLEAQFRDAQQRLRNAGACKVWIDDLGRKFVFCDELWHALAPEYHPAPVPVRLEGGKA